MKTIDFTFKFSGTDKNLEMFAFSGCKYYSAKKIKNGIMTLIFMTEDGDYDSCLDCINLNEAELWDVEVILD